MCSLALQTRSVARLGNSRRERRLNAVIAQYLEAAQSGRAPDRRELLDRHWDLTDGLVSFFGNEDHMLRLAGLPAALARARPYPECQIPQTGSHAKLPDVRGLGEFEVLNEIARGGMGVVYKARHRRLNPGGRTQDDSSGCVVFHRSVDQTPSLAKRKSSRAASTRTSCPFTRLARRTATLFSFSS